MSVKNNIFDAVKSGDLELLISLLQNGTDPDAVDEKGMAPINLICDQLELTDVHLSMIQQLIEFKANVNINKNLERHSPMIHLFLNEKKEKFRFEALKLLIDNKADIMQTNHRGDQVLHTILRQKQYTITIELVQLLIKHGVDMNVLNKERQYSLSLASDFPRTEVAEFLLQNGTGPNLIHGGWNITLLCYICNKDSLKYIDYKMIHLLIQYKADVNLKAPVLYLYRCKDLGDDNDALLREDVLKLLLENNADPSVICKSHGPIPTMIFRATSSDNVIIAIIKLLLENGMDINIKDRFDHTALHYAVKDGRVKVINFLLQHGADPNIGDRYGNTPLHNICASHHIMDEYLQIIKSLLCYKVDVNIKNNDGNTPIISLFYERFEYQFCYEALKLLVDNNADVEHLNNEGKTLLHVIIQSMKYRHFYKYEWDIKEIYRCIEFIIQHGLDINIQDGSGLSPLNDAVSYCNLDLVRFLVKHKGQVKTVQFRGGYFQCNNYNLSNLTTTQNILGIIDILKSEGFQMTNEHFSSVLKFLIGFYVPIHCLKLKDVLESGSTSIINNYIKSGSLRNLKLDIIYNYLYFAHYKMIYMDDKTFEDLLSSLESVGCKDYTFNNDTKKKVDKYIEKAKKFMIGKKTSLLEIISSSPDKTYALLKNCDNLSVLNSENFEKTFGQNSSIFRGHINKSLVWGFAKSISLDPSMFLTLGDSYLISIVKTLYNI